MGRAMGMNPALILLSLSIWGTLMGFIGLIIALPLTTLLLAYYDRYISLRENVETTSVNTGKRKLSAKRIKSHDY